jgi:hypothetical protein
MGKGPALIYLINMQLKWILLMMFAVLAWGLLDRVILANYSTWSWRFAGKRHRETLAQDYLATRAVPGMPIGRVIGDLGPPDWTTDHDDGYEGERVGYVVGHHYMFFGSETVSIYFDADQQGLVTESGFRH